ncbi:response regulator [Leucobacter celer]|uniref:response regulator n=1 Tax=Leucobacter celer TaxID=668625 RepID=UPI0006A760CB|nr:response regulator transcription factor [Leucobacter celer]
MIRVLVADDHPIVRAGIVGLLDTEPDFEVVAEAASGEEAVALAARALPHVVLMDLRMPGIGGVEATRRIVQADLSLAAEPGGAEPGDAEPVAAEPVGAEPVGTEPGDAESIQAEPIGAGSAATARFSGERDALSAGATNPRVLVFTTYEDDDQILAAIEAGASGYLVKAAPAEELAAGIRAVAAGQMVLAPSVAAALAQAARGGSQSAKNGAADGEAGASGSGAAPVPKLTPREREILALVAQGLSNPEIASRLFIGESTVKTHLLHVFEKLEVSDRTRAVIRAMEWGLI